MTEPEQWAVELAATIRRASLTRQQAALTIQRAFEEQTRELREALEKIATKAPGPLAMTRIARQALATRQPTPTEGTSDEEQ